MSSLRRAVYLAVTLAVLLLLFIPLLYISSPESVTYSRVLMGTVVEITISGGDESGNEAAADAAFDEIRALEAVFSSYRPTSDVTRVTAYAGKGPQKVDPRVVEVVEKALRVSLISKGAFDPTFSALSGLWNFSKEPHVIPSEREIKARLPLIDYKAVVSDRTTSTVGLKRPGMSLNLGGVAKGYIVGRAVDVLKERGVERAILKAGGDMFVFDSREKRVFVIGIRHPRKDGAVIGDIRINAGKGAAIATSGDYERFFIKDGQRYHHIIDPLTGRPAGASVSVTIVSEDPTLADALSTAVFIRGPEAGMRIVEGLEGVEAVIVGPSGTVSVSGGLKERLRLKSKRVKGLG